MNSACIPCQTVLIVNTSYKKYRFGILFKELSKQVRLIEIVSEILIG